MAKPEFPLPIEQVLSTLAGTTDTESELPISEVLQNASAAIEHSFLSSDGSHRWKLWLELSPSRYSKIKSTLPKLESALVSELKVILRRYPKHVISSATITPRFTAHVEDNSPSPLDRDVERIWGIAGVRLFISHVAQHQVFVGELKKELDLRGVSAFVAHTDIEPSRLWQGEIEIALRSMQAILAFLTPEFPLSKWTEQEVGWAMGRGVSVLPIKAGLDPYGFIGKYQGLSGRLDKPEILAEMIVEVLLANPQTHDIMRTALVEALAASQSAEKSQIVKTTLMLVRDFAESEKALLRKAVLENSHVKDAFGVPEAILTLVGKSTKA